MAGDLAELRLVLEIDARMFHVLTVKADQHGNVYLLSQHPLFGGKVSHHPNGTVTEELRSLSPVFPRRSSPPAGASRKSEVTYVRGTGLGSGVPGIGIDRTKPDTKFRKTLRLSWSRVPRRDSGYEVWSIPSDADPFVADDAVRLPPYPDCEVVGTILAESIEPRLMVKVWRSRGSPSRDVFIRVPPQYVGTRFDAKQSEADLWLPRPRSPETYGAEPWDTHPALHPELFQSTGTRAPDEPPTDP